MLGICGQAAARGMADKCALFLFGRKRQVFGLIYSAENWLFWSILKSTLYDICKIAKNGL